MNLLNGLLVSVGGLAAAASGIFILLILTEAIPHDVIPGGVLRPQLAVVAQETGGGFWTYLGVSVFLIAAALFILAVEFLHSTRAAAPRMVLLSSEAEGTVRISVDSVRELAERTGHANRSVRQIHCGVRVVAGGIRVRCSVGLRMGSDVPEASSAIQQDVREVVERLTGLPVLDVPVRARYVKDQEQAVLVR